MFQVIERADIACSLMGLHQLLEIADDLFHCVELTFPIGHFEAEDRKADLPDDLFQYISPLPDESGIHLRRGSID
jgi:hypothetical protein